MSSHRSVVAVELPARSLRLSGTPACPRWRGRSHLVAAAAAVPAGAELVARRPTPVVTVYALTMVALFAISAAYHLLPVGPLARRRLRQADHAMIYVFTAASVTAFCRLAVGGRAGLAVAVVSWAGAAAGVAAKLFGFDRAQGPGAVLYVVLGWLAAAAFPAALRRLDAAEVALMAGVAGWYSIGAAVLFTRRPDPVPDVFGYHEVWHAAVVAASACFFAVVWQLAG